MTQYLPAVLAATAVLIAACGSASEPVPSPAATALPPAASSPTPTNPVVPAQLQFTAKTVDGKDFSGHSLVGKPAVLWFWSPWCPTCQREAPMVGQAAATHPAVTFVGVAGLDHLPAMQEFVNTYPVREFTNLADTDGAVWAKFGVTHQPAYAFVGADGSIDVVRGSISGAELAERVASLSNQ